MEKEEFPFSPLQPILFVIGFPAITYFFLNEIKGGLSIHNWLFLLMLIPISLFVWKQLRITFLMLINKPAVILTDEAITITERGYTIKWTDMKDVYLASTRDTSKINGPRDRYVILRIREPEKYIKSIRNPFTRYYRWYTRNLWNLSPFEVSLFLVRGDDDEIFHTILRYYQNNRGF